MDITHLPDTHDLRGPAMNHKRRRTQIEKWALTPTVTDTEKRTLDDNEPTVICLRPPKPHIKPVHSKQKVNAAIKRWYGRDIIKSNHLRAMAEKHDVLEQLHSDGSDNDLPEAIGAASSGDEGITYSFDAPTGPRQGDHLLSEALTQAVQRFEGQQTDKLIKAEYEIVQTEAEAARKARRLKEDVILEVDGFEIV